jgi:fatty-acid peroxygenase
LPQTTLRLLQDKGSVATLDAEAAHRRRKRMFLSMMGPPDAERLADEAEVQWRARIVRWEAMDEVVLLREVEVLRYGRRRVRPTAGEERKALWRSGVTR